MACNIKTSLSSDIWKDVGGLFDDNDDGGMIGKKHLFPVCTATGQHCGKRQK